MHKNNLKTKNEGYAILFTVVVVSIISMITIGLSNTAYKQLILSSVARDSTTAFYQSDIASECALYAENKYDFISGDKPYGNPGPWPCGGQDLILVSSQNQTGEEYIFNLNPSSENNNDKCFNITINKKISLDSVITTIQAKGYNICDKKNMRTVERAVEISY